MNVRLPVGMLPAKKGPKSIEHVQFLVIQLHATARKYMAKLESEGKKTHYIHPFDSLATWEGHSTLIIEVTTYLGILKTV